MASKSNPLGGIGKNPLGGTLGAPLKGPLAGSLGGNGTKLNGLSSNSGFSLPQMPSIIK